MAVPGASLHTTQSRNRRLDGRVLSLGIGLLGSLLGSHAMAGDADVLTKAEVVSSHFDRAADTGGGTRGDCSFGEQVPYWSGELNVPIPDNEPVGAFIGAVHIPTNGLLLEYVQVELEMEHTYAGDVALDVYYDLDNDGFGDFGPVTLMCTPGLAGCDINGCCGCDGDLVSSTLYYFNDNGDGPLGEISCTPVLAGGCYTPDAGSLPLSIFQGLPDGGQFLLYAWDYEAQDTGIVHSYTIWAQTGCNHPNLDVPADYGSITAAITAACDGDTVRIQPGVYHEGIFFNEEISKIVIRSAVPGQKAIVDGMHFDSVGRCPELIDIEVTGDAYFHGEVGPRRAENCTFHGNLTYTGGTNDTELAGVRAKRRTTIDCDAVYIADCILDTLAVTTRSLTSIGSCDIGTVDVDARGNGPGGTVSLARSTVHGPVVLRRYTEAIVSQNIVAAKTSGYIGVSLSPVSGPTTTGTFCNNVWNFTHLWSAPGFDPNGTSGNFSAFPRFCDPVLENYYLDAASPCVYGHHPYGEDCGVYIGYWPVGCSLPAAVGDAPLESMPLVTAQPNPSRGFVTFSLAAGSTPARIRIVDAAGRSVREIEVAASSAPRQASWDQVDAAGNRVASGVYFYRVHSGNQESTKRLVVLN